MIIEIEKKLLETESWDKKIAITILCISTNFTIQLQNIFIEVIKQ